MCDCATKMDEMIKLNNIRIAQAFMIGGSMRTMRCVPIIATERIAKGGKRPPNVVATYCPFCGVKYEAENIAADESAAA